METIHERLARASKDLARDPWWNYDGPDESRYVLSVPLSVGHVVEEGLFLDGNCLRDLPDQNVTLVLTHKPASGLSGPLIRLDWKPLHHHENKGLISGPWRFARIAGTHLHPFRENFELGWERMARDNLPIALPVDQPLPTFREMLDYAGGVLNIREIQRIPEPHWAPRLT